MSGIVLTDQPPMQMSAVMTWVRLHWIGRLGTSGTLESKILNTKNISASLAGDK